MNHGNSRERVDSTEKAGYVVYPGAILRNYRLAESRTEEWDRETIYIAKRQTEPFDRGRWPHMWTEETEILIGRHLEMNRKA